MSLLASLRGPGDAVAIGGLTTTAATIFDKMPVILGVIGGTLGVVWYCVLFYDRFIAKGKAADNEEGS